MFEGTLSSHKTGQSLPMTMILRQRGKTLVGQTRYGCFRGRLQGELTSKGAVASWDAGAIALTMSLEADPAGGIRATWRSRNFAVGGDGVFVGRRLTATGAAASCDSAP